MKGIFLSEHNEKFDKLKTKFYNYNKKGHYARKC